MNPEQLRDELQGARIKGQNAMGRLVTAMNRLDEATAEWRRLLAIRERFEGLLGQWSHEGQWFKALHRLDHQPGNPENHELVQRCIADLLGAAASVDAALAPPTEEGTVAP